MNRILWRRIAACAASLLRPRAFALTGVSVDFLLLAAVLASGLFAACGTFLPDDTTKGQRIPNQRPDVRITAGAATADSAGIDYKVEFRWHGTDDDGVIALYQYAIDDTISESAWKDTTSFSSLLRFRATHPEANPSHLSDWHAFYVRAVDNEFAKSKLDTRYFNARTIAPVSRITFPNLRTQQVPQLLRTAVITWDGDDLDSSRPDRKPLFYEYKMVRIQEVTQDESAFVDSILNGDNLLLDTLRVGSKKSWIRVPESQRTIQLNDLPGEARLAFAVRAIDEAGATEPVLERNRNYLTFIVRPDVGKPFVTVRESSLGFHTFPLSPPIGEIWEVSVPSNTPLRFKWEGDASGYGSLPGNSNYALDIPDPEDETVRDPRGIGGWIGWGRWEGNQYPFSFSPSEADVVHTLWVKMRDITDAKESERICKIQIKVVVFTFNKFGLIVDDARFGRNPDDATTDAYYRNTLLRRATQLGSVDDFILFGSASIEDRASQPNDLTLEKIAQYQHIFWSTHLGQNTQWTGLNAVERSNGRLSSFVGAGGRLFLFGSNVTGMLTGGRGGSLGYPKEPPNNPDGHTPEDGFDEDSFLWKFLHLRSYVVSIPTRGNPSSEQKVASGMIGARSLHPAYPDLSIDTNKWNPSTLINCDQGANFCQFRSGISTWDGVAGTPQTIVEQAGLDSLYAVRTFNHFWDWQGETSVRIQAAVEGAIIGQRYESTHADTLSGRQQGRTVLFSFQPWYLDANGVLDAGTSAVNWLVTGRDH